jgi:hypothetical protein
LQILCFGYLTHRTICSVCLASNKIKEWSHIVDLKSCGRKWLYPLWNHLAWR